MHAEKCRGDRLVALSLCRASGFSLLLLRFILNSVSASKDLANRESAIKLVGEQLKLNPKQAEESVNELSTSGNLNLPGLQVEIDLRTQFGFKLNKGDQLPVYYDASYFNAAKGK
jgi:hypothetical protein